jgi:isopenicillin-N epimerase
MFAPKGTAFLYAREEIQAMLNPLVVSWGWHAEHPGPSRFIDYHEWQGTFDPAAYLSVPAAIDFQKRHDWGMVQLECHQLVVNLCQELISELNLTAIATQPESWFAQMAVVQLPEVDVEALQTSLREEHNIEVVCQRWEGLPLLRVSIQAYNQPEDGQILLRALKDLLPG